MSEHQIKTFLVIYTGPEGCDYSIGCGVQTKKIRTSTPESAMTWAMHENNLPVSVHELKSLVIYEILEGVQLDMDKARSEKAAADYAADAANKEAEERRLFEKLLKKFGNKP